MLARVLLVVLTWIPECREVSGASYSAYYDADANVESADFYDSYNDEIKQPPMRTTAMEALTRLRRNDLEDIRTLNPEEINNVKGVLNNIMQGKKPEAKREMPMPDYTDSYEYLANSNNLGSKDLNTKGSEFKKWLPTVQGQTWSKQTGFRTTSQATEQTWSFVYQPETSTFSKNDIIAEVRRMMPEGVVPLRSSINVQSLHPPQDTQTSAATGNIEENTIDIYPDESTTYSSSNMQSEVKKLVQNWSTETKIVDLYPIETSTIDSYVQAEVKKLVQHWSSSTTLETRFNDAAMRAEVRSLMQDWSPINSVQPPSRSSNLQHWHPTSGATGSEMHEQKSGKQTAVSNLEPGSFTTYQTHPVPSGSVQNWNPSDIVRDRQQFDNLQHRDPPNRELNVTAESESTVYVQHSNSSGDEQRWNSLGMHSGGTTLHAANVTDLMREGPETTTTTDTEATATTTTTTIMTTTTSTTTTQRMDIEAIMAIISNLTYDYEWNLTEQFNKSIIDHGVPTCPGKDELKWGPGGAWTATLNATTSSWNFDNGSVVSKCFVCGLTTPEIPRNAYCADAFAGDFLPLMPIDARSRSMIANYRKYCRYIDVQNYIENPEEPRSIYGRFTGGCAVRWTDITGVYTQRTCRSKYRPLLGKHFASKRMAKLELALVNVENGCIISPMATLLPVSRGISLYARFHACVCSSNWCNRATIQQTSFDTVLTILIAHWLAQYS